MADTNFEELQRINSNKTMTDFQKYMLDMFKQIVSFLESNNLKYYIIGGTLIGAVRHKGFIPWDDDIDIAMPREDYDRLLNSFVGKLPSNIELRTYMDDSYHHYYFARFVDKRYTVLREGSLVNREEELWIDIFPLDGLPKNPLVCLIHKFRLLLNKVLYHFSTIDKVNLARPNRPLYQRLIIKAYLAWPFKIHKDYRFYLNKIDKLLKKYPEKDSIYSMEFMGSSIPFKETILKEQYGDGKSFQFEDIFVNGPVDYEYYLKHVYGDYMKLPPEEKRDYHKARLIVKE